MLANLTDFSIGPSLRGREEMLAQIPWKTTRFAPAEAGFGTPGAHGGHEKCAAG